MNLLRIVADVTIGWTSYEIACRHVGGTWKRFLASLLLGGLCIIGASLAASVIR